MCKPTKNWKFRHESLDPMSRFEFDVNVKRKADVAEGSGCARRILGQSCWTKLDRGVSPTVRPAGVPLIGVVVIASISAVLFLGLSLLVTFGCWKKRRTTEESNEEIVTVEYVVDESQRESESLEGLSLMDIDIEGLLGKGEFGKVYKGVFQGNSVAVKVIEHGSSVVRKHTEPLEALLSKEVDHPNVVRTYWHRTVHQSIVQDALSKLSDNPSAIRSVPSLAEIDVFSYMALNLRSSSSDTPAYCTLIIMELCDRGSLDGAIADKFFLERDSGSPKYASILLAALDIAYAMTYLHEKSIIHGDLKACNVLLKRDATDERGFQCKVADFGLSRMVPSNAGICTSSCGTVRYMPPELLKNGLLTPAADVYSFGMLLWELISGTKPYHKKDNKDIVLDVVDGIRPPIPPHWPLDIASLIESCWDQDHTQRPTFPQIVSLIRSMNFMYSQCQLMKPDAVKEVGEEEATLTTDFEHQGGEYVDMQGTDIENQSIVRTATSPPKGEHKGRIVLTSAFLSALGNR